MATPVISAPAPRVNPRLLRELHAVGFRQGARLLTFLALYAAAAFAACRLAAAFPHSIGWRLGAIPLYLLAAASLHGISLFTHEAVHGTLSRHRFWNASSALCAAPMFT